MSLYLITPPTDEVVTLAEAKKHLRQTSADYDELIQVLINAAVQQLDPAGGGWLGRALRPQTWEIRGDGFPFGYTGCGYDRTFRPNLDIEIPYPPLISVDSVKHDDEDEVEQTLVAGTGYRVIGLGTDKARIAPVYNGSWPSSVLADDESVRIRFTCGYPKPEGESPDALPAPIKQAVLLMFKELWGLSERNLFVSSEDVPGLGSKSFVVTDNASKVMRAAVENLLSTYRVFM